MGTKKKATKKGTTSRAPRALTTKERAAWEALDRFAAAVCPAAAHELRDAIGELLTGKGA